MVKFRINFDNQQYVSVKKYMRGNNVFRPVGETPKTRYIALMKEIACVFYNFLREARFQFKITI